jgi:hypothetical protein
VRTGFIRRFLRYTFDWTTIDLNILLVRADDQGDSLSARRFFTEYTELPQFIYPASDGNFLILGTVSGNRGDLVPDLLIFNVNTDGDSLGSFIYGGNYAENISDIAPVADRSYVILGTQRLSPTDIDMWMVGFDDFTNIDDILAAVPSALEIQAIYPNPFNLTTNINFSTDRPGDVAINIYNMLGQWVFTTDYPCLNSGDFSYLWNPTGLASGVYFIRLSTGTDIVSTRAILLK